MSHLYVQSHNQNMLHHRKKGERFYVSKGGRFKKVKGWRFLHYFFCRSRVQATVKQTVTNTLQGIDVKVLGPKDLKTLLFDKMARLSARVFDRAAVTEEMVDILIPSLKSKRDWKKIASTEKCLAARYAYKVESVRLASKLGVKFERISEGVSSSYLGKDRFGKALVVFKPSDQGAFSVKAWKIATRIKLFFRKLLKKVFGVKTHEGVRKKEEHLCEVGASFVNEALNLDLVPHTRLVKFSNAALSENGKEVVMKMGSCQLFKTGYSDAEKILGVPYTSESAQEGIIAKRHSAIMSALSQEKFEELAIFDFLIGNCDRHVKNWLIKNKRGRSKIAAIDNGMAFVFKHSEEIIGKIKQYRWRVLPQAEAPISKKGKALIQRIHQTKEALYKKLNWLFPHFKKGRQCMEKRIQVLTLYANSGKTLRDLGHVRSAEKFRQILP